MKTTALHTEHETLGAKMVPYAGFSMPVQYTGVLDEHKAVREAAGMFDVSHMGEFMVKGKDSTEFLNYICSNDITKMVDYQAQYNCMPNDTGGIVDDLIVYKWPDNEYNVVVNAANIQKDWDWMQHIKTQKGFDVELSNISDDVSLIAIQGPKAIDIVQQCTPIDLSEIQFYHFLPGELAGATDVIISNTGYTGSGGFEIYVWNKDAVAVWNALLEAGQAYGLLPCGLAARDTLRLEKGYCLYGNDITDDTSPLEAGLGWITKLNKPNFVAKDILAQQKEQGVARKLCAVLMEDKGIPRQGYPIVLEDGTVIGEVTSGTQSPMLKKGIALGYIQTPYTAKDTQVCISIREKPHAAQVVALPFV